MSDITQSFSRIVLQILTSLLQSTLETLRTTKTSAVVYCSAFVHASFEYKSREQQDESANQEK
jgi:hypothetical protein